MEIEPKKLIYQGTYGKEDNPLPKVKYEDIPKERCKKLLRKRFCNVAPEDFEEWLAVELDYNKDVYSCNNILDLKQSTRQVASEEELKFLARYYRAEYHHLQTFAIWEKEKLKPLVRKLVNIAKNDPQYDFHFLYRLEHQKLLCMEAYLSHSRVADDKGNYVGKRWLVLCIDLLSYIEGCKDITIKQVKNMNIKNLHGLLSKEAVERFNSAKYDSKDGEFCDKFIEGKDIYIRKMERLYYQVRLYKMRYWWE